MLRLLTITTFLVLCISLNAQVKYEINFNNGYGKNFNFLIEQKGDSLEISLFKDFLNYSRINMDFYGYSYGDKIIKKYSSNDSITEKEFNIINEFIKPSVSKRIQKSKYPLILEHLKKIYKSAKCNLCQDIINKNMNYCSTDIFIKINGRKDLFIEHKEEIKLSYHYLFYLIKEEFKTHKIVQKDLDSILTHFEIYYMVTNEKPLIVEIFPEYYKSEEKTTVDYNFPDSESIYIILKGPLNTSQKNIEYLKNKYKNIFFISNMGFFSENMSNYDFTHDLTFEPHLQEIDNLFSQKTSEIKFNFSNKKTKYDHFIDFEESGEFKSKKVYYTLNNNELPYYYFLNYITGFNIGLNTNDKGQISNIEVWDTKCINKKHGFYSNFDYPFPLENIEDDDDKCVYKINTKKNNFNIQTSISDKIIKGIFNGVLYNKNQDSIIISNGSFTIKK